jgi:hypothetical protein
MPLRPMVRLTIATVKAPELVESLPGARSPLTVDRVWVVLAIGLPVVGVLFGVMGTVDLAYHVRAGQFMLDSHRLIRTDSWTFSARGMPWLDQQWLAQITFALLYRMDGWAALAIARAGLVAITYAAVLRACREAGAGLRQAVGLTFIAFALSLEDLPMRPQMIAFALFAVSLWMVERRRRSPGSVWIVVALMVPWANIHGSFPLGLAILFLAFLEDLRARVPRARTTGIATACAALATLVNPFGWRAWAYAIGIGANPTIRNLISEWQPPTYHSYSGVAFFVSVALLALYFGRRLEPVPWLLFLRLGLFFGLSLIAMRSVAWWGLAMPVALASVLPPPKRLGVRRGSPLLNAGLVLAIGAALVIGLPWFRPTPTDGGSALLSYDPEGLVRATAARVPAGSNLFVAQVWGSWFEFRLPQDPVFVDSRIEIFPQSVWDDWVSLVQGREGWQQIMDRLGVDAAILNTSQTGPLVAAMQSDPGWTLAYKDDDGYLFVRANP